MKKLLGILVLGLLWCNISFAEEIYFACLNVMVKDRFYIAREEVKALTQLLKEAHDRQRHLLKKENQQGWWDWLCEWIGY